MLHTRHLEKPLADVIGTIIGGNTVILAIGHNLSLTVGQDSYDPSDTTTVSRSSLMNGGGFSALIGHRTLQDGDSVHDLSDTGSLVGSTNGAATLSAGNTVHLTESFRSPA